MPVVIGDPAFDATKVAPSEATFITLSVNTTLTDERVLTGTSNQIVVTDNGAGSTVVLSLPQSIHTAATPTFSTLTLSGLTSGSVLFAGASGLISQDNANLFWDDTNNRLGIGTATPSMKLNVVGTVAVTGYDVSPSPTVSGVYLLSSSNNPSFILSRSVNTTQKRMWDFGIISDGVMSFRALNDAYTDARA